jgi:hypothetical protein
VTIKIEFLLHFRRASSSGSLDGTCAVINDACTLLEIDFGSFLQRQLRQGYSSGYLDLTAQAYNMWQSSIQQGRLGPTSASDSDTARATFLVSFFARKLAYFGIACISIHYTFIDCVLWNVQYIL